MNKVEAEKDTNELNFTTITTTKLFVFSYFSLRIQISLLFI